MRTCGHPSASPLALRGLGGPLPCGAGLASVPRAPSSSTPLPHPPSAQPRGSSLEHRVDCGPSCSQPFRGSSRSSDKARCPGVCWGLRPALPSSLGVSAPSFHCSSPHGLSLKCRAQPWHSRALSVCLHAPSFSLSLSLVLATWLEPSLPSPLSLSPFSAFQHLLCPLLSFQGLQPDARRAGPACPARGCDPGTTTRP